MVRFKAEKLHKSYKSKDNCVGLSTHVVLGGGGNLKLAPQGFRGLLKKFVSDQAARLGFTLAEVLITLGIIGVVAALTMPALIANYQKKQTVAQLKEVYSILTQAVSRSVLDNGELQYWNWSEVSSNNSTSRSFAEMYILPYLSGVQKNKGDTKIWTKLDGTYDSSASYEYTRVQYMLSNGALISFIGRYYSPENAGNYPKTSLTVFVDVNGYKRPNRLGRDVFLFTLFPFASDAGNNFMAGYYEACGSGIQHYRLTRDQLLQDGFCGACNRNYSGSGYGCAALIMKDGWEIKDDYPW